MNLKSLTPTLAILALLVCNTGCKKEAEPTDETNQLCDGTTSADWVPLTDQNHWEWKQDGSTMVKHTWDINGTAAFNGNTYVKIKLSYNNGDSQIDRYFRKDSSGDIYEYSTAYTAQGQDFLYLPVTPVVGLEMEYPVMGSSVGEGFRKVTSVNDAFSTLYCDGYSDVLKIEEYSASNQLYGTFWYKKGLGLLRWKIAVVNSDLMAVSLK